LIDIIKLL